MNDKITFPALAQLLALRTGDSKKQAEDFIKEFFALVSNTLAEGEQVRIKDLGVFKCIAVEARKSVNVSTGDDTRIPAHRKVVFVPCKELAALINQPFEMFDSVELADNVEFDKDEDLASELPEAEEEISSGEEMEDVPEEVLNSDEEPEIENEEEKEQEEEKEIQEEKEIEEQPEDKDQEEEETEDQEEEKEEVESIYSIPEESEPQYLATSDKEKEEYDIDTDFDEEPKKKSRFGVGFLCGLSCALAIGVVAFLAVRYFQPDFISNALAMNKTVPDITANVDEKNTTADEVVDTVAASPNEVASAENSNESQQTAVVENDGNQVPTQPSDAKPQKVYDTITKTRYLTTMAKDHYGNFNLWPYIYEENKSFLGHPDRIKPGTQVVIPDLKKYGVDATNPADIAKAKRMGVEIYSRYK